MKRIMKGLRKSKLGSSEETATTMLKDGRSASPTRNAEDDQGSQAEDETTSMYTDSPHHITTMSHTDNSGGPGPSEYDYCHQDNHFGESDATRSAAMHLAPQSPSEEVVAGQPHDRYTETRNLVKKFIADIWNRGELDLIPSVCSQRLRFNGNTGFDRVGHDGLARMVGTIRDALDEYHCEIHSMVVEDNKAFCRLRFTGKHVGSLLGYPPTNQTVAWMGATEFTCQNGKILKVWELGDVKSLEEQLENARVAQLKH